jgi:NtrC-family two-component system response regulator AlgB
MMTSPERSVMERVTILWPARLVEPAAFPRRIGGAARSSVTPELGGDFTLEQIEQEHIARVLSRKTTAEGAARTLDIDASTLWRKRQRYQL